MFWRYSYSFNITYQTLFVKWTVYISHKSLTVHYLLWRITVTIRFLLLAKQSCCPLTPIPRNMKTILKTCPICNQQFNAPLREVNRGNARVCSRKCGYISSSLTKTKIHDPNVTCKYCNKEFYIPPSKLKNSRSGLYFCCRSHKDLAQRISFGMTELWPDHYKTGGHTKYRKQALQHYGEMCQLCNYDEYPAVLQVHHIDHNRMNNALSNLLVCCPTCHMVQHITDGKFSTKKLVTEGLTSSS